jgi:ubiquinone/menaquinone biosynthesis C-methylase UbiE/GNAT superfamily N-acetyltransferase
MSDLLWNTLSALYERAIPKKVFWRAAYEWIAGEQPDAFSVMNYGYLPHAETSVPPTTGEELGCALYAYVARPGEIQGKCLLEVGAGRGGGLAHLVQTCAPRLAVGIDLSQRAVALARRRHAGLAGLSFLQGDAEAIPFGDASFDAVINVESSHCYPSRERFYREAARVLAPGGFFLHADFFARDEADVVRTWLQQASLALHQEEDITTNVLAALRADEARKLRLVERAPERLRATFRNFAATTDSDTYRLLATGERRYLRFALRRPEDKARPHFAARPNDPTPPQIGDAQIVEVPPGPERDALWPLFRLADDSEPEIRSYYQQGRLLLLRDGSQRATGASALGLLLLTDKADGEEEIKSLAIAQEHQGRGLGKRLVRAALDGARHRGTRRVWVATGNYGVGPLAFYQKLGFRLSSIERDAFSPAHGYPPGLAEDGVLVRDRVWLEQPADNTRTA